MLDLIFALKICACARRRDDVRRLALPGHRHDIGPPLGQSIRCCRNNAIYRRRGKMGYGAHHCRTARVRISTRLGDRSFAAQRVLDRGVAGAVCDRRCVLACGFSHRNTCPRIEPAIGARGGRIANRLSPHVARLVRARSGRSTGDHRNFCFDDLAAAGRLSSAGRQTRRQTICTLRDRKAS